MPPLAVEWLNLLIRWIHVLAAIMWVGDSFLFMWMDSRLEAPSKPREGNVAGELWMVHSGGFYELVKRRSLAPHEIPRNLYWFKWQSYATWISGILLLVLVYWMGGSALLVEPGSILSHGWGIVVSLVLIVAGFQIYDRIWMALGIHSKVAPWICLALLVAAAWGTHALFSPRAAYLVMGAMIGTLMAGNVAMRIIPAQNQMLAATREGREVDLSPGLRAKSRSIHNHYLTLPVLFIMLSPHFPATYGHPLAWVVLVLIMIFGAALKYVMNLRGQSDWRIVTAGAVALIAAIVMTARPGGTAGAFASSLSSPVPFEQADAIVQRRCVTCHAVHPSNPAFPEPPNGIVLEREERLRALAPRILVRAVQTKTMPLGNLTGMTDAERDTLGAWIAQGARGASH